MSHHGVFPQGTESAETLHKGKLAWAATPVSSTLPKTKFAQGKL